MAARDPRVRSANATIAALERWSREDPRANAERGQQGLRDKFLREVTAEFPELPAAELERRARARYRAHFVRIRKRRMTLDPSTSGGQAA